MSDSVRPHRRHPTRLPLSLGFSRQEHWSGLPFPSPMHESESQVAQSCLTPSDPMDCSLPGSSVHGIFQARVLEWGAIAFSVYNYSQSYLLKQTEIIFRSELLKFKSSLRSYRKSQGFPDGSMVKNPPG